MATPTRTTINRVSVSTNLPNRSIVTARRTSSSNPICPQLSNSFGKPSGGSKLWNQDVPSTTRLPVGPNRIKKRSHHRGEKTTMKSTRHRGSKIGVRKLRRRSISAAQQGTRPPGPKSRPTEHPGQHPRSARSPDRLTEPRQPTDAGSSQHHHHPRLKSFLDHHVDHLRSLSEKNHRIHPTDQPSVVFHLNGSSGVKFRWGAKDSTGD